MAEVKTTEERRQDGRRQDGQGMQPLAHEVEEHYTRPLAEVAEPIPRPFPRVIWQGLLWGSVIGAALGLLFAVLLFQGVIAPSGWEAIFSLGPFTFHFFWTMMGAAVGLFIGGLIPVLTVTPEPYEPERVGHHE